MIESLLNDAHSTHRSRRSERYPAIDSAEALFGLLRLLQEIGLAADWGPDELVYIAREIEYLRHVFVESGGDRRNLFMRLSHLAEDLRFRFSSRFGRNFHYRLSRILEEERYRIDYSLRLDPRAHPEQPD